MAEKNIKAELVLCKYSNDPTFDMYYEPILHPKAQNGMMLLMFQAPCNFRCKFCFFHNMKYQKKQPTTLTKILAELENHNIKATKLKTKLEAEAIAKGKTKKNAKKPDGKQTKIDFVCFSGSECTQHTDLIDIARAIKATGTGIHIHTNGTNPIMLKAMFEENLIDFVAMDIKGPKNKYEFITGVPVNTNDIDESINLIKANCPEYKFRTTIAKELLTKQDIIKIGEWLVDGQWYEIKGYWDSPIGRGYKQLTSYTEAEMQDILDAVAYRFDKVTLLMGRRGIGGT